MRGVCVDALNNPPSIRRLRTLGADGVRLVAFDAPAFYTYARALRWHAFDVAVVLARESFSTDDYGAEVADYARQVDASCWIIGNEQDAGMLNAESPSSWSMNPDWYADFFRRVAFGILSTQPTATIILGGFVAGQPDALSDYLAAIRRVYSGPIHGYDVHPYGKNANETALLLAAYQELAETRMRPYVLEWNRPTREIGEYATMLGENALGSAWFCAGDWMVAPMGLWSRGGKPKAAYHAYREALK